MSETFNYNNDEPYGDIYDADGNLVEVVLVDGLNGDPAGGDSADGDPEVNDS